MSNAVHSVIGQVHISQIPDRNGRHGLVGYKTPRRFPVTPLSLDDSPSDSQLRVMNATTDAGSLEEFQEFIIDFYTNTYA